MGSVGARTTTPRPSRSGSGFKREAIDGEHFATRAEARWATFSWVIWYNSTRLHTSIGMQSPFEYEDHLARRPVAA